MKYYIWSRLECIFLKDCLLYFVSNVVRFHYITHQPSGQMTGLGWMCCDPVQWYVYASLGVSDLIWTQAFCFVQKIHRGGVYWSTMIQRILYQSYTTHSLGQKASSIVSLKASTTAHLKINLYYYYSNYWFFFALVVKMWAEPLILDACSALYYYWYGIYTYLCEGHS